MARAPADLARLPLRFDLRAASLAEGVRAALSVAAIVALDTVLHQPLLMIAALGALLTCLCDPGGPLRARLAPLLGFAVLGAAAIGGFGLAGGWGLAVALPLAGLAIFAGTFARIFGQAGLQIGNLFTVVVVIALELRLTPDGAAAVAGAFLVGGAWATLLTLAIWRIFPFGPARQALAQAYAALARLAGDLRAVLEDPALAVPGPAAEARWAAHARAYRSTVRAAIEAARATVLGTLRARGTVSRRGTETLTRLEAADQAFGALIALSETLEQEADPAARAAAAEALRRLRPLLLALAAAIGTDNFGRVARLVRSLDAMERSVAGLPADAPVRTLFAAIAERLRVALTQAALPGGGFAAADAAPGAQPGWLPEWLPWARGLVRANLDRSSLPLRHALRAALAAMPALGFTLAHPTPYGHWLTITLVLTMQPYFGLTWLRALERVGGTVAGGLLAAALSLVVHGPLAIAATLFPLLVLSLSLRTVSYALFITTLTPIIVLLVELDLPGTAEPMIALMRAVYTVAGGLLAVVSCLVLWPSFEPARVAGEVQAAIAAHARYAAAVLDALASGTMGPAVEAARRAAGLASNNLEASLSRALLEPRRASFARFEPALTVDAALRRMAGRLLALQYDPEARRLDPQGLRAWSGWIGASLSAPAGAEVPRPPAAPGGGAPTLALSRIARQIALIRGAGSGVPGQAGRLHDQFWR
ncbi:MAG: FUSC family protein [Rhodospirillales bacterium]|nr:FUSC family protein [Rhodospirillales bacterium]